MKRLHVVRYKVAHTLQECTKLVSETVSINQDQDRLHLSRVKFRRVHKVVCILPHHLHLQNCGKLVDDDAIGRHVHLI